MTYDKQDNEYLLREIARLKAETEEIRRILKERQIRMDELEKNSNFAIMKVGETLNRISEQLEEVDASVSEALSETVETIREEVAAANKPLQEQCEKLGGLREKLTESREMLEETKADIAKINTALQEKAEKKSIIALHQRFTTLFAIGVVDLIGTIMTLALLCYLIISIAR